jgi:hypothetical protein
LLAACPRASRPGSRNQGLQNKALEGNKTEFAQHLN